MRQEVQSNLVDARRKTVLGRDNRTVILYAYDEAGTQLGSFTKGWCIDPPRRNTENSEAQRLTIVEQATDLTTLMDTVHKFRYEIVELEKYSDYYTQTGIEAPALGRNRVWLIDVVKEKYRQNHFTAA